MAEIEPNKLNVFHAALGPLLKVSDNGLVWMVKGRIIAHWAFCFYFRRPLKDGVTYMISKKNA